MKIVRPSSLIKAPMPDLDEVEIWRLYNSMTNSQKRQVIDRVKNVSDPVLRERASKLLRAAYVV